MKNRYSLLIALSATLSLSSLIACSGDPATTARRSSRGGTTNGDSSGSGVSGVPLPGTDGGVERGVGPGDASTTPVGDPTNDPATTSDQCNYLDNEATPVTSTSKQSSPPTATGTGEQPLDGIYDLTSVVHYGSGGSDTYKATAEFSAGIHHYVITKNNGPEVRTTMGALYVGSTLTLTGKCGTTATQNLSYTLVSPTQIVIYDPSTRDEFTYTRPQPAEGTP